MNYKKSAMTVETIISFYEDLMAGKLGEDVDEHTWEKYHQFISVLKDVSLDLLQRYIYER